MTGFAERATLEVEYLPGQPGRAKVVASLDDDRIELWFVQSNDVWRHDSCVVPMPLPSLNSLVRKVDAPTLVGRAYAALPTPRLVSQSQLYAVPARFADKLSGTRLPTEVDRALLAAAVVHRLQHLTQLGREDGRNGLATLEGLYAALAAEFPNGPGVRGWRARVKGIRGWVVRHEEGWSTHSDVQLLLFAFQIRGGPHLSMTLADVTDEERAAHALEEKRFWAAAEIDEEVDNWERYLHATDPEGQALAHLDEEARAAERLWARNWEVRHRVRDAAGRAKLRRRATLRVQERYPE